MERINTADFVKDYIVKINDKMCIAGDQPCTTYSFQPTKAFLNMAGLDEMEPDPYDDFEYYIDCEIVVNPNGTMNVMVGDNFDTKEYELDGSLEDVKKLVVDYEASL